MVVTVICLLTENKLQAGNKSVNFPNQFRVKKRMI